MSKIKPATKVTSTAPANVKAAVAAENKIAATSTPADETLPSTKGKNLSKTRAFTYIGAGASSPYVIVLMGKQKFVRGELTEVTDPEILAKIDGMSTFVEGPVDAAQLHEIDHNGKEQYETQLAKDQILNARYNKKHRGE